jgi:hypothetical protein
MPGGSTIIRYEGSRGVVWKYKLRDADGRHVKRTVGREADGVTRKDAEAAARSAVVAVESRGWWKPPPLTFEQYARTWFAQGERTAGWKPNTVFAHPEKGTALNSYWYADEFRAALSAAGISDYVRPFHDRHGP